MVLKLIEQAAGRRSVGWSSVLRRNLREPRGAPRAASRAGRRRRRAADRTETSQLPPTARHRRSARPSPGRPADPRSPINSASLSRTACSTARPHTASTIPGSACVISLRLRVQTRTSSPRQSSWMRIPSSFHSTDARSKLATALTHALRREASIGRIGRNSSRPMPRSPSSPSARATSARAREIAGEHQCPAHECPGTPAAFATASTMR
jgi:hypothetical protein